MSRALLAAIVLAAASSTAGAQPAPPPSQAAAASEAFDAALAEILGRPGGLTAAGAATRAIAADPTVARKRAETEETRTQLGQIRNALVPITTVSASYTRLSAIDPIRFGPTAPAIETPTNAFHLGGELAIPVTELVVRLPLAKQAIEAQVAAGEHGTRAAERDAGSSAEVAYYEWVRASLGVVAAQRQVAQVEATRAQVAALVEVQRASRVDLSQLEAQKAQAELGLHQLERLVALRADQLRIAIGAGADEPLAIGEDVRQTDASPALADEETLVKDALDRRFERRALDAGERALSRHRKEAAVDRLPKLNLFAQVNYDKPNQRVFLEPDQFNLTWAAGAQLTWSVNDFLGVDPKQKAIDAQARQLAADRAAFERGVRLQISAARTAVVLADQAYDASQRGLAAAQEAYQMRLDLYDSGRATTLEVTAAETALTAARITAIDALIDRRIAWAQLRHAAGLDLP